MTKFLLDSGDPKEYKEIIKLAKTRHAQIWGATTNPSSIAKTLTGRRLTTRQAFSLQKEIVMEIHKLVPGAVSAEVYCDESTTADEMVEQGLEIASWSDRMYVKLPTTREAFIARTQLREKNIPVNNTLVFSQQQIFAICLHESIIRQSAKIKNQWPPFISPFVGRLDDKGDNGMRLVENGMKIKALFDKNFSKPITWMLPASLKRRIEHFKRSLELKAEIITAPASTYREWFSLSDKQKSKLDTVSYIRQLTDIPYWKPSLKLTKINSINGFMSALRTNELNIFHPLTDSGLKRFAADWQAILASNK